MQSVALFSEHATWSAGTHGRISALHTFRDALLQEQKAPSSDWSLVDALLGNSDALNYAFPETLEIDDYTHLLAQLEVCNAVLDSIRHFAQTKLIITKIEKMQWVGPLWKPVEKEMEAYKVIFPPITLVIQMITKLFKLYPSMSIHAFVSLVPPGSMLLPRLADCPSPVYTRVSIGNLNQFKSADHVVLRGHKDDVVRVYSKDDIFKGPKFKVISFISNLFSYCSPLFIQRVISVYNLKAVVLLVQKSLHCMPAEVQNELAYALLAIMKRVKLISILDYYSMLQGANADKGVILELGPLPIQQLISVLKLGTDSFYCKSFLMARAIQTYFDFVRPIIANASPTERQLQVETRGGTDEQLTLEPRKATMYDALVVNGYSFDDNLSTYSSKGPSIELSSWIHRTSRSSAIKILEMLCSILNSIFSSTDFAKATHLVKLFQFLSQANPSSIKHVAKLPFFAKNSRDIVGSEDFATISTYLQLLRILIASLRDPLDSKSVSNTSDLLNTKAHSNYFFSQNSKFDLSLCLRHARIDNSSNFHDKVDSLSASQMQEVSEYQRKLSEDLQVLVPAVLRPDNDRILLQSPSDRYPEHVLAVSTGGGFFSFSYTFFATRPTRMYSAADGFYAFVLQGLDKIKKILSTGSERTKYDSFGKYISLSVPKEHVPKLLIKYFPNSFDLLFHGLCDSTLAMQFLSLGLILETYTAVIKRCRLQQPDQALFSAVRRLLPSLLSIRGQVERIINYAEKVCLDAGKDADEVAERLSVIGLYLYTCFSNMALLYNCTFGPLSLYSLNDGKWIPKDMATTEGYIDLSILRTDLIAQRKLYRRFDNCHLGILTKRFQDILQIDLSEDQPSPLTILLSGSMSLMVGERCRFSQDLAQLVCDLLAESSILYHPSMHKFSQQKLEELAAQLDTKVLCEDAAKVLITSKCISFSGEKERLCDVLHQSLKSLIDTLEGCSILFALVLLALQKQLAMGSIHAATSLLHLLILSTPPAESPIFSVVVAFPIDNFINNSPISGPSIATSNAIAIDGQVITRHTHIKKDSPLHKQLANFFITIRNMLYWEDALLTEVLLFCINFLTANLPGTTLAPANDSEASAVEDLFSVLLSFILLNTYGLAAANNTDSTVKNCIFLGKYQVCQSKLLNRCIDLMRTMDLSSSQLLSSKVSTDTIQRMIPSQNIDRIGAGIPLQLEYINIYLSRAISRASVSVRPLLLFTGELNAHIHSLYSWKDISIPSEDSISTARSINLSDYQGFVEIVLNLVPHPLVQHTRNFLSTALTFVTNITTQTLVNGSVPFQDVLRVAGYPILVNSSALLGSEGSLDHLIFIPYIHVLLFLHNGTMDSHQNVYTVLLFSYLCRAGFSLSDIYGYSPSSLFSSGHISSALTTQLQILKSAANNPDVLCLISSIYPFLHTALDKAVSDPILFCTLSSIDCAKVSTKILAKVRTSETKKEAMDYISDITDVIHHYKIDKAEICPVLFGDIFLELLLEPCATYEAVIFKGHEAELHSFAPSKSDANVSFAELTMFNFEEPERLVRPEKVDYKPNTNFEKEYNDLQYQTANLSKKLPNRLYGYIQRTVVPAPYRNLTHLALRMAPGSLHLAPERAIVTIEQLVTAGVIPQSITDATLPLLPLLLLRVTGADAARPSGPISHLFSERYTPGIQLFSLLFIMHGYEPFFAISRDILMTLLTFLDEHRMEKHADTRIVPLGFVPSKIQVFRYKFIEYCRYFQRAVEHIRETDVDLTFAERLRALRYMGFLSSTFLAYVFVAMPEEKFDRILANETYGGNPLRLLRKMANREFRLAYETNQDELLLRIMHRNHSILVKYCYLDIDGLRALSMCLDYQVAFTECSRVRGNLWKLNDLVEQEHEIII
ncbi:Hypothetical protein GLP15_255 [Giardia lamblia P15]|uniref:Uncharacterized protein n=1 Tax=Giardia intestinalis (strain P15) TaxID=658858 RepID=E1F5Y0_GIAIA|nr:Hypothetical protein GLP15_255 [Giardia lamblia P15]